jgi:hypothetical protein
MVVPVLHASPLRGVKPTQIAKGPDMEKITARHLGEARHLNRVGEQAAIHVGEPARPISDTCRLAPLMLGVHGTEHLADHLVGVLAVTVAHHLDR